MIVPAADWDALALLGARKRPAELPGAEPTLEITHRHDSGGTDERFTSRAARVASAVIVVHRTEPSAPLIAELADHHLDGVLALMAAQGWSIYVDQPERTHRALTSPGSTALVALEGTRVVGLIHVQSDGALQAHLSALVVAGECRGTGIGRRLLREGLDRAGGIQIDIRTATEGYYERLGASRSAGYRLTRADLGLD